MKIQVPAKALRAATGWAVKIAPKNPAPPIIGCVLIDADDGLRLSATDYSMFGTVVVPDATVPDEGRAVVSARLLDALVSTVRAGDEVLLELGDRGLEMSAGRTRWTLPVMGVDEWPPFPDPGDPVGEIDIDPLARALARTIPMISTDADRPNLHGVQFGLADDLTLAATDSYRLAVAKLPWQPGDSLEPTSIVIPAELLRTAKDALSDTHGRLTLRTDENTVSLTTERHAITGRLLDTPFPDWPRLIPQSNEIITTVTIPSGTFESDTTQVGTYGKVESKGANVKLQLSIIPEGIAVHLHEDENATSAFIKAHAYSGKPITVVVSHTFLREAIIALGSPMTTLRFTSNPGKPFLIAPADDHGDPIHDGYEHLLMTMKARKAA